MLKRELLFWKFWEKVYPYVISIFMLLIIIFFIPDQKINEILSRSLSESTLTIAGILFGFLLTVLALLLQVNNKTMDKIHKFNRFNELISYNKQAVFSTLVVMLFSVGHLIYQEFDHDFVPVLNLTPFYNYLFILSILIMSVNTYRYTDIFYTIIKN